QDLDSALWEASEHNPRFVLERMPAERLAELAVDPVLLRRAGALEAALRQYLASSPASPSRRYAERYSGRPVAYFSAEFAVHESLPIYSGGLGVLAGDHLKSASDLGLPLVGVGLRYQQGYFSQTLDRTGWQQEVYRDTDFGIRPTGLILKPDSTPVTVEVPLHSRRVVLQLWAVRVGRVPLLLLDSNREDNDPVDRWITAHLYGGNRDTRLAQEMVLGIGGVRALRLLGYQPAVFHMNEGHAAFLALELIREGIARGQSWEEALNAARSRTVFTTHTPVPAGHDVFEKDQFSHFMGDYLDQFKGSSFEAPREKLLALGRKRPDETYEDFGMTPLAIHSSRSTNGVSRLHGEVAREMWRDLWPGVPVEKTPITHITNGVHIGTWMAPVMRELLTRYLGAGWEGRQSDPRTWEQIDAIPDEELWEVHLRLKQRLVQFARERAHAFRRVSGETEDYVEAAMGALDPEALTLGFARRVATYKRLGLLLHDPERALSLLGHPERPVQLLIAGKAHPGDSEAKRLLQYLFKVRFDPRVLRGAMFLVDYQMAVAREMVQGCDVWLNLPRRPLEASGTSGMKAVLNGGLNCSILDGWWAEGYNGRNGWAVGTTEERADTSDQDRLDADSLYRTLEEQVIPLYYQRDGGLPRGWIRMMKDSVKTLAPIFNTHRMVEEYATHIYAP
ncbi:MAG TPA: alpha-glucan family phosphorylase, partial [Armatimonadota bacterium]|nr:alpha-glucan family phosphorylase [Armatimonadota bacterium]